MSFLALLAALGTIFGAGFGITILLGRDSLAQGWVQTAALSWLFGVGFVSLALWLLGFAMNGVPLQALITLACLGLGYAGWKLRAPAVPTTTLPHTKTEIILLILLALGVGAIFFVSAQHTLGWDGLLVWEIKARYAFLNGGVIPADYYTSAGRTFSHTEYPLALPLTEAWVYLWLQEPHQFWIKFIFPFFHLAGAVLIATGAARASASRAIGYGCALLFFFVPFLVNSPGGVIVGYADLPLAIFYLAAITLLLSFLADGRRSDFALFCALLALLPWLKREGVILWATAAFCGVLVTAQRREWRRFLPIILPGLCLLLAWKFFLQARNAAPPQDFLPLTFATLAKNLTHAPAILRACAQEALSFFHWSIFWPALALAFVVLAFRKMAMPNFVLAISVAVPLAAYCTTYFFSAWRDPLDHLQASLPRLFLHLMPLGWIVIALALCARDSVAAEVHSPAQENAGV